MLLVDSPNVNVGLLPSSSPMDEPDWPDDVTPESEIFDFIRDIKDPEYEYTLEQLNIVKPDQIQVEDRGCYKALHVQFTPTVPHCHLATLIGLCIRVQLERNLNYKFKLDIQLSKGSHNTEDDVNKQINDKERICAAMENPELSTIVEECLKETSY
eukprot:comp25093_c0_seq1/m.46955 comp25093_c0_seq1/g.46955  ORF comp25093_c0_seq1/g.46955 comp25093_c0_seq1/m.46955 type:complete len:156 (-) comp25093_c0_seq1:185-652(-)